MYGDNKNPLIEAARLQSNGQHRQAAAIYQKEGNKERNPSEKETLWEAASHARSIANSD